MTFTIAGLLRTHAAAQGEASALTYGACTLTWATLHERAARVAQALLAEGVRASDRVVILDKNGPEHFELLFGGGMVGAIHVAVNWRLSPHEIAYILDDADAKILVVGAEFARHLHSLDPKTKVVVIGTHEGYDSYEAWLGRHPAEDPATPVAQDDVALQLYTSGTTGLPKGVMLTNANLGTMIWNDASSWSLNAAAVSLLALPLFHIGGVGWALAGMAQGCHSVLVREFDPAAVLTTLQRHRVTHALYVPAMLQMLTAVPEAADGDYSSLRVIAYGASPISETALVRAMQTFKCDFVQLYGLTETTGAIIRLDPEDHADPRLLRSAGRPSPWVEVRIVDPSTGEDQPAGKVGELWTRSTQNMKGYWRKPAETAAALDNGWLKTGDAGYLEEGYVFLTDRVKDLIVTGGENVYPAEVENVLASHPGVADVTVIGVPHERWGETVKAIVVPAKGAALTAEALIGFARGRLAGFKCPTSVDFVEELPRTLSGKVLKRVLREPYWAGHERRIH